MLECPECARRFDLFDPVDAEEWEYGHDCPAEPVGPDDFHDMALCPTCDADLTFGADHAFDCELAARFAEED